MPSPELLSLILVITGIIGFSLVATVGAALWEKRPIQPYYIPKESEEYKATPAAQLANRQAAELGFHHDCLCHDGKGKLYRVRYDFWVSPDALTLAEIGCGTVAAMPTNGIWLYSRTTNGKILCTTNEIGEQDISGIEELITWPNTDFAKLFEKHSQRLDGVFAEAFDEGLALQKFFEIRASKADSLVERGHAYYLTDERLVWRYSLRGALVFYVTAMWIRPILRGARSLGLVRS